MNRGDAFHLSVEVVGTELQYQWRFEGDDIPGATSPSLAISSAGAANIGDYDVVVSNVVGVAFSSVAALKLYVPLDFNGDYQSDILWHKTDGTLATWLMNGTNRLDNILINKKAASTWDVAGHGDFNGDNHVDIVWTNVNRTIAVWFLQGTDFISAAFLNSGQPVSAAWTLAGVGDLSGDHRPDLLWQNTNGIVVVWVMNGTNRVASVNLRNGQKIASGWQARALADINRDTHNDIFWHHTNGVMATWLMNGTDFLGSVSLNNGLATGAGWQVVGAADFNHDAHPDILFQGRTEKRCLVMQTTIASGRCC